MNATNPHILVLDDDDAIRQMLRKTLQHYGYDVTDAGDAQKGVDLITNSSYDAVLVDVMMPGMSGHGFLRATSQLASRPPIIMMSGEADLDDVVEGFRAGITDFLTKPFKPIEVANLVSTVIERTRTQAAAETQLPAQPAAHAAAPHPAGTAAQPALATPPAAAISSAAAESELSGGLPGSFLQLIKTELASGNIKLPEPEPLLSELAANYDRPDIDAKELANLLEKHPACTARVLHLSRSAMYSNRGSKPVGLLDAIKRLGTRNTVNAIRTLFVQKAMLVADKRLEATATKMWENTIATAALARILARRVKVVPPDTAYLLALFHNIGEMLILRLSLEMEKQGHELVAPEDMMDEIIQYHGELGFALCRSWKLDDTISTVARKHHDPAIYDADAPDQNLRRICASTVLANHLALQVNGSYMSEHPAFPSLDDCQDILKIPATDVSLLISHGKEILENLREMFGDNGAV